MVDSENFGMVHAHYFRGYPAVVRHTSEPRPASPLSPPSDRGLKPLHGEGQQLQQQEEQLQGERTTNLRVLPPSGECAPPAVNPLIVPGSPSVQSFDGREKTVSSRSSSIFGSEGGGLSAIVSLPSPLERKKNLALFLCFPPYVMYNSRVVVLSFLWERVCLSFGHTDCWSSVYVWMLHLCMCICVGVSAVSYHLQRDQH